LKTCLEPKRLKGRKRREGGGGGGGSAKINFLKIKIQSKIQSKTARSQYPHNPDEN
jgi:hypothetical protein